MEDVILVELFKEVDFLVEEFRIIGSLLKRVNLKKGDVLLSEGDMVLYIYFVYSGCLRIYFLDDVGKEYIL